MNKYTQHCGVCHRLLSDTASVIILSLDNSHTILPVCYTADLACVKEAKLLLASLGFEGEILYDMQALS